VNMCIILRKHAEKYTQLKYLSYNEIDYQYTYTQALLLLLLFIINNSCRMKVFFLVHSETGGIV
jgi:hypothetical protein